MGLPRFPGGLSLPGWKPAAAGIARLPLPPVLRVPLLQHAGLPCEPCVAVGERVARFQPLGRVPAGALGAAVHSPAGGRVRAIEPGPTALPGRPEALHVLVEVETGDTGEAWRLPPLDPLGTPAEAVLERLAEAGVAGLGGAGFPAADKLAAARRLLILNGAECEPVVASDAALVQHHAGDLVQAAHLLARCCGAGDWVLALEAGMEAAIAAARQALAAAGEEAARRLVVLPDRYPAGAERSLILAVAGLELPEGELPRQHGVLVQNVATAVAALRAVRDGEPLVSRLVTAGGPGLRGAGVWEVAIGTPAHWLAKAAGGWALEALVLRAGGPMMGTVLPDAEVAIGKTTIALTAWPAPPASPPRPCIRCGDCAGVCPARLLPQQLHARLQARDRSGALALGLMACVECAACDVVCPSAIPLSAGFRAAREAEREHRFRQRQAEAAKQRFEARTARLEREAEAQARADAEDRTKRLSSAAARALAKARARRGDAGKDGGGDGRGGAA